jgi:farnesyl-diphosphate farnesyltransferase
MDTAPTLEDEQFQTEILIGVSRTFALTIPQLPGVLRRAVGNAYLLCRIADTIEDDPEMSKDEKVRFSDWFVSILQGAEGHIHFENDLSSCLAASTPIAEKELIESSGRVLRITHDLRTTQKSAITRCVLTMTKGMMYYQGKETLDGLADQNEMDRYCYYVAGVVGEMLTELFCDYCPELEPKKELLLPLSVSFGQALQMTNILKDVWIDQERGACWLPRTTFQKHGVSFKTLVPENGGEPFRNFMLDMLATAYGHLSNALSFTLLLPRNQTGIRRFCLWALGMSLLTIKKIGKNPNFTHGSQVKISRRSVKITALATSFFAMSNTALKLLFKTSALGLKKKEIKTPLDSISDLTIHKKQN